MEKIHKLIIIILAGILACVVIVGIIFSVSKGKDETDDFDYKNIVTTTYGKSTSTSPSTDDGLSSTTTSASDEATQTTTDDETQSPDGKLDISAKDLTLKVGDSSPIEIEFADDAENVALDFKSDNEAVATVDGSGNVTGISVGSCEITITTDSGDEVNVEVVVTDEFDVTPITEATKYSVGCNFREGPGTDYPIIAYLDPNTEITVVGEVDNSYKATVNGVSGYVGMTVVTDEPTEQDEPVISQTQSTVRPVSTSRPVVNSTRPRTTTTRNTTTKTTTTRPRPVVTTTTPSTTPAPLTTPPTSYDYPDDPEGSTSIDDSNDTPDFIIGGN